MLWLVGQSETQILIFFGLRLLVTNIVSFNCLLMFILQLENVMIPLTGLTPYILGLSQAKT
jgi:hypothetical protein